VLVTNDDGIASPGLLQLATAVIELGHDTVVAAPRDEASGSSCSLVSVQDDGRTLVEPCRLPGLDGVEGFSVSASPAFISLIALRGAFGPPPEMVVSGVNEGPNTGHAVIHSGTVGAALTASTYGALGVAVSMEEGEPRHWETARWLVRRCLPWVTERRAPTTLNLNVPNLPVDEIEGIRWARLAPFGTVQTQIVDAGEGWVKLDYTEPPEEAPADSDAALLAAGFATVTALRPTAESVDENLASLLT
jgi:5'-nucleotidase